MRIAVTHERTPLGQLVIRHDGEERPDVAEGLQAALDTRTPCSRRNYLRLSLRFLSARAAQGIDPMEALRHGPAYFRAALARWHRNESGRFAWEWDGDTLVVFLDDQEDEDVTEAINRVLRAHAKSSRRKYTPFLLSFINFIVEEGEDPHAFVTGGVEEARYRVQRWLEEELELVVDVLNGRPDSSVNVLSETGPINHRALGVAAIRQLYGVLQDALHVRADPNPLDIDGLHTMEYYEKMDLARSIYGLVERLPKYFGSQFVVTGRKTYVPIPHDPLQTYVVMKAAVDELEGFPPVLKTMLRVMDTEGPRHHDIRDKGMDAWAASGFGDWMWGGNKGSDDPEYKKIIFGPELADEMKALIDGKYRVANDRPHTADELIERVALGEDPRPSMALLEELRVAGRMDVLARIPMFPAGHGGPYSYSGWNKWLRKAMEGANGGQGAWISTTIGNVRPTAVWLRRAMFTERVKHAASETDDPKILKIKMDEIRHDAGHRSEKAIYRYIASIVPDLFDKPQFARAQASRDRVGAARAGLPAPPVFPVQPAPELSSRSARLRGRARD